MKKGSFLLLLTALIWGMAFVAQSTAMDHIGPWTFNCLRSVLACLALFLLLPFLHKITHTTGMVYDRKKTWIGGIVTGCFLAMASQFQQMGIMTTTVGKAGFITALYVVFVPLLGLFTGKKPAKKIWLCTALAVAGLYFLCMNESLRLTRGDTLVLICALLFAGHIMAVDAFRDGTDPLVLSCIQFGVMALICAVGMVCTEKPVTVSHTFSAKAGKIHVVIQNGVIELSSQMSPAATANRASAEVIVAGIPIADEVVVISGQNPCGNLPCSGWTVVEHHQLL